MKFKVGDKVIVAQQHPFSEVMAGTTGVIIGIDEDWTYPYEVDFDEDNLYDDELLEFADAEKVVAEESNGESRKFRVTHRCIYHEEILIKYLTTLIDEQDKVVWAGYTLEEPKYNQTLSGFFRAMDYLDEKYEVIVEYYEQ